MRPTYDLDWITDKFNNDENIKFLFFWGHTNKLGEEIGKYCLSQWFELPFVVNGITYKTAEHWMMANKALLFGDLKTHDKIIKAKKPGEAKQLGREVMGFDDIIWNKKRFEIVLIGNIHKFNQHPQFAKYLTDTGDRVLVEASPADKIWGIGLSKEDEFASDPNSWYGLNLLGFALMETRDFLKQFGHFDELEPGVLPFWKAYPNVDPPDMFWRMGKGEEYVLTFWKYFDNLSRREKTIFQVTNIPPLQWENHFEPPFK